ncbi:hypothetical protein JCM10213_000642 [Rhodosporidiobolus nylandii]
MPPSSHGQLRDKSSSLNVFLDIVFTQMTRKAVSPSPDLVSVPRQFTTSVVEPHWLAGFAMGDKAGNEGGRSSQLIFA